MLIRLKMSKETIKKLSNARVSSDKKWLYTLIRYCIENHDDYTKIQKRIVMAHKQSKGYFSDYYKKKTKTEKASYSKLHSTKQRTNSSLLKKQRDYQSNLRLIYKLYKSGKLSEKSINKITKGMI